MQQIGKCIMMSIHLKNYHIPLIHDLSGVGQNLQDHLTVNVSYMVNKLKTFSELMQPLMMIKNLYGKKTKQKKWTSIEGWIFIAFSYKIDIFSPEKEEENDFLHRGIAKRQFSRRFTLSDDVVVKGADLYNGLLTIDLERVIPEEKKPREIPINDGVKVVDHKIV